MTQRSKVIAEILKEAVSLHENGVNNWALTSGQVLQIINALEAEGIPVLGGDIYVLRDRTLQPNGDSWFCDPDGTETQSEYLARSYCRAREYVSSYNTVNAPYFVLVW